MSETNYLLHKLYSVHYPIEVKNYNAVFQKIQHQTNELRKQYINDPPELQQFENEPWFPKYKDLIKKYIREGRLAPIDGMMGEGVDVCSTCFGSIENVACGYNFIQCSNVTEGHLICTQCLFSCFGMNEEKDNVVENQQLDIAHLKMYCQICKKLSPIVYHQACYEDIMKYVEESGEEIPSTISYFRF